MTKTTTIQLLASALFLILAVVFINPFKMWMPDMLHMLILGLLVVVFGAIAAFVVSEQAGDEREERHQMLAGRAAFLTGATIILSGIVWQAFTASVDFWLVIALCGMVVAKACVRIYGENKL
jgi:drug/metabolite transporter (DMT)-like permease